MAKSLSESSRYSRARPALFAPRVWLSQRRQTLASSEPSQGLRDSYLVGPSPRPRHERRGEFPMMLPSEDAAAKEADLLFLNDLSPFQLEQLATSLRTWNDSHTLATYCEEVNDWVSWNRCAFCSLLQQSYEI